MATLHVRGVPDELYERLAERARERDTSITAETIRLLEKALELDPPGRAAIVEFILANRIPVKPGSPSAAELIREDRER
jgi:plasmid stability protein